jgi:hypothetical protein
LEKAGVFGVVFCGDFVVDCWLKRGGLMAGFGGLRIRHLFEIFLWKSLGAKSRFSGCAE